MTEMMTNNEPKKYIDAIYKAERMLIGAEYELRKVLREVDGFSDEDKDELTEATKDYNFFRDKIKNILKIYEMSSDD